MKGLQKMDPKNRNRLQQALQGKRTRTGAREESATDKLMIQDFFDMKPIKLPADAWKDHKKLTRFLGEVHEYLNRLVRACQMQTRLMATELVARPTYAEEFQNIRGNMAKAVAQNYDGTFSDVGSQRSGHSHRSHRSRSFQPSASQFRNKHVTISPATSKSTTNHGEPDFERDKNVIMEADENTDEDHGTKPLLHNRSFKRTSESDEKNKNRRLSQEFNIQELDEEDEDDKSPRLPQKKITELGPSQEVSRENTPREKKDSDSRLMNMQLGGIIPGASPKKENLKATTQV